MLKSMKVWCECVCMRCDQYPGPLTLDCGLVSMVPAPCQGAGPERAVHSLSWHPSLWAPPAPPAPHQQ